MSPAQTLGACGVLDYLPLFIWGATTMAAAKSLDGLENRRRTDNSDTRRSSDGAADDIPMSGRILGRKRRCAFLFCHDAPC